MKRVISPLVLTSLAALCVAGADIPRKGVLSKYSSLWTSSPFTSKPPPAAPGEEANPFEDYTLIGVSPIDGGYRVTIMNKKDANERIFIESSGSHNAGFQIEKVVRQPGDPMGTSVRLRKGSQTGTVRYDEKTLTLATAQAPAQAPPNAQPQPNGQPQPNANPGVRPPRPRVVPPPGLNPPQQAAPNNNQGNNANPPQPPNRRIRR